MRPALHADLSIPTGATSRAPAERLPAPRLPAPRLPAAALLAAALLAAALLAPAGLRAQAVVGLLNKERKVTQQSSAMILAETLDTVRFRTKAGSDRSEKTADIAWIEYGQGSPGWEQALKAQASSDFAGAETLFAAASRDTDPPWVAAHALLRQSALAARRGKDGLPDARAAIETFLKRFPDHRLLPGALLEKARLAALAGDEPAVAPTLDAVVKLSSDGRVTPDWAVRAQLLAGEIRLEAGATASARLAFAEAEKAATAGRSRSADRPDVAPVLEQLGRTARAGTGSCLLAADDVTGARLLYQQLAREGEQDIAIRLAAENGLAECDFRDPAHVKEAQLAFAKVAVTGAGVPAERARALYFLGRCADELGRQNREPDGKARAVACWEEVVRRYPDTHWARLAGKSLP